MWYRIRRGIEDVMGFVGELLKFVLGLVLIMAALAVPVYPITRHYYEIKAQIVNEEFGTSYTWEEMFWVGHTIETLVLGNKTRIDLDIERK